MTTRSVASLVTSSGILLYINGQEYAIGIDHPNFDQIRQAVSDQMYDGIEQLIDIPKIIRTWLEDSSDLKLVNDRITLDGISYDQEVTDKVLSMIEAGNSSVPIARFLRKSVASKAKNLLLFCVANGFMIHEDGDIIAYKSVQDDYYSFNSGTRGKLRNMVGDIVTEDRNLVDDNSDIACSSGLHGASFEYATTWNGSGGKLMVLKINPADVISIPKDHNAQKLRCCRYEVIAEIPFGDRLQKKEVYCDDDIKTAKRAKWDKIDVLKTDIAMAENRIIELQDEHDCALNEQQIYINSLTNARKNHKATKEIFEEIDALDTVLDNILNDMDRLYEQIRQRENDIGVLENS